MKKSLIAALALAATSAFAAGPFEKNPTVSVEYNYHRVAGDSTYSRNNYAYVGLAQPTSVGTFDIGLQGAWAHDNAIGTDRSGGFEAGYSYPIATPALGTTTLIPRIAYGTMNQIDPGRLNARYWLASLEAQAPIASKVGVYVSGSHMNGINSDSVVRANRVQAGLDLAVAKNTNLRVGYSNQKFGDYRLSGVVAVGSYSF